jgi:hypothetical protein
MNSTHFNTILVLDLSYDDYVGNLIINISYDFPNNDFKVSQRNATLPPTTNHYHVIFCVPINAVGRKSMILLKNLVDLNVVATKNFALHMVTTLGFLF